MPLPKFEAPLATATKASQVQGGTAIEEEAGSGTLLVVGALLAAGALVAVLVMRGGDAKQNAQDTQAVATAEDLQPTTGLHKSADPEIGISTAPKAPSQVEQRASAIAQLGEELSGARLWATVSVDASAETTISVVSSACEQEDMQPTLRATAAPLKEAGFTTIVCVAKHGAQIFEFDL